MRFQYMMNGTLSPDISYSILFELRARLIVDYHFLENTFDVAAAFRASKCPFDAPAAYPAADGSGFAEGCGRRVDGGTGLDPATAATNSRLREPFHCWMLI